MGRILNDANQLQERNRKVAKTISAQLKRLVKSGDNSHYTLEERRSEEFEVIENVGVLLRLRLKDKTPPCVIKFKPTTSNATFRVFYSEIFKEPDEIDNHGSEVNVSGGNYLNA